MNVLDIFFQNEIPLFNLLEDVVKSLCKFLKFIALQQSDGFKHSDMRLRTENVIFCQSQVEDSVISHRKFFNQVSCLRAFAPECVGSHNYNCMLLMYSIYVSIPSSISLQRTYSSFL